MAPSLYLPVFLLSVVLLCGGFGYRYITSPGYELQEAERNVFLRTFIPLAICVVLVFWLGTRSTAPQFGDTFNYALMYDLGPILQNGTKVVDNSHDEDDNSNSIVYLPEVDLSSEWFFDWIMNSCRKARLDVHVFFTIIEAGYILSALWAVVRLFPSNPLLALLFVLSSLMFYSFGVNGIRNGLACHIVLLAITFLFDNKYIIGGILCLLAFGIHRSTALPILSILAAMFVIKDIKIAIGIWFASILVSLVVGGFFVSFFASTGFDDRMANYTFNNEYTGQFSNTGFRWDFLLYSAMPILMAWYVSVKRNIQDNWYNAMCVAYCLSNAFWVLVIRAEFSNRFAYLSWFMYPLIIVYPLISMPVWEDQDKKTGQILLAYCGFTLFMNLVYW